jgi:heme a synthase
MTERAATTPTTAAARSRAPRLRRPGQRTVARLAVAALVANALIVATGGLVRLTGSGLGCPDWPNCAPGSLVPTSELDWHSYVEFGNRALTDVVAIVAVVLLGAALLARPRRRDVRRGALLVFLGIPAQAALGGVTVVTHLNPWVVSLHFLLSMVIVAVATWLVRRAREGDDPPLRLVHPLLRSLAVGACLVTAAVLYLGTVVTGSGPHAGAPDVDRIGVDSRLVAQLHADAVMLLVGLSIALAVAVRATAAPLAVRRATLALVAVELGQAVVGYAQYFTHLPIGLVDLHLLGATTLVATLTWTLTAMRDRGAATAPGRAPAPREAVDGTTEPVRPGSLR